MKDNMVQELLLKALLAGQEGAVQPLTNQSQRNKTLSTDMLGKSISDTLLKSLYLNNAQNNGVSNIKNVNNSAKQKMPHTQQIQASTAQEKVNMPSVFEEFMVKNPDFFRGRQILFDYLNSSGTDFDVDELTKIAEIAKAMEEEAIKRFCAKNPKYAQFLMQENSKTLNKLENTANSGLEGQLKGQPYFSEKDILKMSSDEFLKNENAINAQIDELLKNRG